MRSSDRVRHSVSSAGRAVAAAAALGREGLDDLAEGEEGAVDRARLLESDALRVRAANVLRARQVEERDAAVPRRPPRLSVINIEVHGEHRVRARRLGVERVEAAVAAVEPLGHHILQVAQIATLRHREGLHVEAAL